MGDLSIVGSEKKVERWIFYFLCGYALFSSTSIAVGNIFLSLSIAAALFRVYKKHDDWRELLRIDRKLAVPFLLFVGMMLFTSLFSTDVVWSLRVLGDHYLYRMTGFYLLWLFIRDRRQLIMLFCLALLSHFVNDAVCIYQGVAEGHFRVGGIIGYMMTGGNLVMWLPVLIVLAMENKFFGWRKYAFYGVLAAALMATLLNATRGVWLAIGIIAPVLILLFMKSKLKGVAVLALLAVFTAGIFYSVPVLQNRLVTITDTKMQSNSERLLLWQSARNMFADYPITGVGYGEFHDNYQEKYILPEAKERYLGHAHSNFFQVLAEGGILGVAGLLAWWLSTAIYCIRGWFGSRNIGYLTFLGIFAGIMLQGMTEYTMGDSIVMKLFWFGLGMSYQWIATGMADDGDAT